MAIVNCSEQSMRDQLRQKWRENHAPTTRQFALSLVRGLDTTVTEMQVRLQLSSPPSTVCCATMIRSSMLPLPAHHKYWERKQAALDSHIVLACMLIWTQISTMLNGDILASRFCKIEASLEYKGISRYFTLSVSRTIRRVSRITRSILALFILISL